MTGERGQTSLDFAVGMSTLLLVFAFVLTFVPGILGPFTTSGQEETVTADRVADHLAEGLLAEPGMPYVLNTTCTKDFLNDTADDGCAFDDTDPLRERVGLSRYEGGSTYRQRVNVSVVGNVSKSDGEAVLCWDAATAGLIEADEGGCGDDTGDVRLTDGDSPPTERSSVVATRRVVSIDGQDATLLVRVW